MKNTYSITDLEQFIVAAKSKTYVGGAKVDLRGKS